MAYSLNQLSLHTLCAREVVARVPGRTLDPTTSHGREAVHESRSVGKSDPMCNSTAQEGLGAPERA